MRTLLALIVLCSIGAGCTPASAPSGLEHTIYTSFVINVHDWVHVDESVATLNRIVDIHEQYSIPVDVYLDDQVVQKYVTQSPELIDRLKTSEVVAVSYHLRPPYPYYNDFDWLGLDSMSKNELSTLIKNYETHAIDLVSGQPTEQPGGYAYLTSLIGYAPYAVAGTEAGTARQTANRVYADMGAQMTLVHNVTTSFGDKEGSLWLRPEDLEVKFYEGTAHKEASAIIEGARTSLPDETTTFLNLKWHENNFYSSGTPWAGPYYGNAAARTDMLQPPFNMSRLGLGDKEKTPAEEAEQWQRYEDAVRYISDHNNIYTAVNIPSLILLLEESETK